MRCVGLAVLIAACGETSTTTTTTTSTSMYTGEVGLPDGEPMRVACTEDLGQALASTHGRLDGRLVAIVPVGAHDCNGDDDHVHLQVLVGGQVYDVAVNMQSTFNADPQVQFLSQTAAPMGDAWTEGWHPGFTLDYAKDLGAHAGDFMPYPIATLADEVDTALATANHVSIYGTGYGPDGMHKIHRDGHGHDGAIVVAPLSSEPQYLLFRFADQTF